VFTTHEYERRIDAVESAMAEADLDALIAYSAGHQPGPVSFLGGYEPRFGLHDVAYFVIVPGRVHALLANGFWDDPAAHTWVPDVTITSDFSSRLAALLPPTVRRLGIAGLSFFPAPVYAALSAHEMVDATLLLKQVARIKSAAEADVLRRCARMSEAGGRAFVHGARDGVDERGLQWEVDRAILRAGADALAFRTLLFSGDLVPIGIGFARSRMLHPGEQVNIVCGAALHGYRTEVGRVTAIGQPSANAGRVMDVAVEMHAAMLDATRPGEPVRDIANAAVRVASRYGLAENLYRSANAGPGYAGHGMGCWYSELPDINTDVTDDIEPGMLLILEARLGVPATVGATITDPVLVTPTGAERLVDLPVRTWDNGAM
jgi:Xaa-Pro aminopeptidase